MNPKVWKEMETVHQLIRLMLLYNDWTILKQSSFKPMS